MAWAVNGSAQLRCSLDELQVAANANVANGSSVGHPQMELENEGDDGLENARPARRARLSTCYRKVQELLAAGRTRPDEAAVGPGAAGF